MSYVMKGKRKSKVPKPSGVKFGKYLLPSNVAIPALMVLLFVVITAAGASEPALDAFVLRLTGFVLFAVLAYAVRTKLCTMKMYAPLIDAFTILFVSQVLWSAASFLGLAATVWQGVPAPVLFALLNLGLAAVLVPGLLYIEKSRLSGIFFKTGKLSSGLSIGAAVLAAGAIGALAIAYIFFGAARADSAKLLAVFGVLAAFSAAAGITGEAWFRGLFLSRLTLIAGRTPGIVLQAILYAVFQAAIYYAITADPLYAYGVLLVSAIAGFALAYPTLKNDSLLTALLAGTGINLFLAMPLFATVL